MKNLFKLFIVAIATTAFVACSKDAPIQDASSLKEKTVCFTTSPLTKTVFGTPSGNSLPTLWTDSYSVAISLNYASAKKSSATVVGDGGTTARFSADIADDESGAYTFYAVSPYDQFVNINSTYTSVQIDIPTAQTTLDASPDEKAQILFGQYDAGSTFPTSVTLPFNHLTAYGKISFSNLALADGESVASVSLTAAEYWAGRFYYYVEANGSYAAGDYQANSASKTITIATNKTSDIWFGCAPVDLGGKTIDVVITTNSGSTYSKTITIPAGKKFTSGVVNSFTINMAGIAPDGAVIYSLVNDVADLTLGSEVIIVADQYDYALSTTQNGNNRGQASVIKSTSGTTEIIASPGVDVQVLTIGNGTKAGSYSLSTGSGYLYAVSGQNNLKTNNVLDDTGSWYISVTEAGVATIKSVGTTDIRLIKYNNSNSIFNCYASGQKDIRIYKKNGTGSGTITPKVAESLSITGATTNYTVGDTYSFNGTVNLVYNDSSEETLSASDYTVDSSDVDMTTAGTYTITITYNSDQTITETYSITVSGGGDTGHVTVSSSDLGTASTTVRYLDNEISYYNSADNTYSNPMRIYAINTFTISSKTKSITEVVYTCNSNSYATILSQETFTVDSGASVSVSVSGKVVTVTITGSTTSVVVKPSAQVRLDALAVTYESDSGGDEHMWRLVTDASSLSAGDIIVFAAYNVQYSANSNSYTDNKVMGAIANDVGTAIDVTFGASGTTIPELPASAQQYTLGGYSGRWTFFNGSKYLAWGNKKLVELDSADNWTISFNGNNAIVTSVSSSSYSLQYNPNSGKGRFASYSSSQKPIRIYRYE